jgi:hypothetical protein
MSAKLSKQQRSNGSQNMVSDELMQCSLLMLMPTVCVLYSKLSGFVLITRHNAAAAMNGLDDLRGLFVFPFSSSFVVQ